MFLVMEIIRLMQVKIKTTKCIRHPILMAVEHTVICMFYQWHKINTYKVTIIFFKIKKQIDERTDKEIL